MISYRTSKTFVDCIRAHSLTSGYDRYYPDFDNWFWNKVVPSTVTGNSDLILAEEHGQLVGVAMTKSGDSPKLRCLRVLPSYAGRGVGIHLIDRSLKVLDHDFPVITIPEEIIHDLSRIVVNRFGFNLKLVEKGLYRPGKLEYQFNGDENQRVQSAY